MRHVLACGGISVGAFKGLTVGTVAASALAGVVVGVVEVVSLLGSAILAFPGPLQAHIGTVLGAVILGGAIAGAVGSLISSIRGILIDVQESPAILLGLFAISIWATFPEDLGEADRAAVFIALFALTTVITGLFFLLLGSCRLGTLIRFIPYPVVGGVLAGLGVLLVIGAVSVSAGETFAIGEAFSYFGADDLLRWGPSLGLGVLLVVITRRFKGLFTIPACMLAGIVVFYAIALGSGVSHAELESAGWMLGPLPEGALFRMPDFSSLARVDFAMVGAYLPVLASILLVATIGLLLHASALELALRSDVDLNRELQAAGIGNIGAGAVGGLPAFHSLSTTLMYQNMRALHRLTPLFTAAAYVAIVIWGSTILSFVPRPVLAGMVFYMGLSLIWDWVVMTYRSLPRADWLIIVLIVLTTAAVGYLEGIGLGVLAGIILFQIGYTKVPVVKHALTGAQISSNLERAPAANAALREQGERCLVLQLQGYLFFGTAHTIVEQVRARLEAPDAVPLDFVLLDFRRVQGLDSATVTSFSKLHQMAGEKDFTLVLTAVSPEQLRLMKGGGVIGADASEIELVDSLDHGLEWIEDRVLEKLEIESAEPVPGRGALPRWLVDALPNAKAAQRFKAYLDPVDYAAGDDLIRQGDPSDCLYILRTGKASVYLESNGMRVRVRSYLAGTVVGEIGLYLGEPRTATVAAETDLSGWRLDAAALKRMGRDDPDLSAAFDRAVIGSLSVRLADTNRLLSAVMD